MIDEERWSWRDQPGVTWAAGAAAVGLIALLVFAVFRTSTSSHPSGVPTPATSSGSAESSLVRTGGVTTSTSYSMPSVLTSEGTGPEVSAPPTVEAPASEDPVTSTTTTTPNPYVTTTTQNGGAV